MLKTITSVANTVGSLEYKGLWNAATNTPTLVSSVGTQGDYYVVSVAGTTNLDGVTTWDEGDWAIFNGSVWQLFQGGQDGVFATLTVSGEIAANGGIALGDNDKATFGGSDDLQIYHDGTASYISDTGTGTLNITASGSIRLRGNDTDEFLARFNENGSNQFYYDNSEKLSTTATGIDISGTATMDGLTVDAGASDALLTLDGGTPGVSSADAKLAFIGSFSGSGVGGYANIRVDVPSGGKSDMYFQTALSGGSGGVKDRLKIDGNGDVSFYEDTGSSPKFFWDASAESLGIGTSSPAQAKLDILLESDYSSHTGHGLSILSNAANAYTSLYIGTDDTVDSAYIQSAGKNTSFTSKKLLLNPNGGNVGIGTSLPQELLHLAATAPVFRMEGASRTYQQYVSGTNFFIRDVTAGLNRVTLDASGNVGIGATPNAWLSTFRALQLGQGSSLWGAATGNNAGFDSNVYVNSSGGSVYVGSASATRYQQSSGYHRWYTAPSGTAGNAISFTQAMTLDDSGNLLVGKTGVDAGATAGFEFRQDLGGLTYLARAGNAITLNRLTTDGDIALFRKDGTTVGSIGVVSNDLNINGGANHSGIRFQATGLYPLENGTASSGEIDLGAAGSKFKNLYLSGGVVFGTTGGSVSSKTLEDYEEGTWTPTLEGAVSAGSYSVAIEDSSCKYTKVGRQVTVTGRFTFTVASAGSSYAKIGGLPFATSATNAMAGAVRTKGIGLAAGTVSLCALNPTSGSVSYFAIGQSIDNAGSVLLDIAGISSTDQITVTLTYFV
jgi:hypothetical protein